MKDVTDYSSDIRSWAKYEISHTPTLSEATITDFNAAAATVDVSITGWSKITKKLYSQTLRNVRYLTSYTPQVGDIVVVAYIDKSVQKPVVIGRITEPGD